MHILWSDLSHDTQKRNPGLKELLQGGKQENKQSKYHSKKVLFNGIVFDSQKEANRYAELLLAKKAGIVKEIELQPRFLLQEGYRDNQTQKKVRKMEYVADFRVTYADGRQVVIDTKGFRTKVYINKLKLFRKKYPDIEFIEE